MKGHESIKGAYGEGLVVESVVEVGDHTLLVGGHLEDEVEELLAPRAGGEVHLEVVRVDVEEQAAVIALVISEIGCPLR